jgi:hypothetical protein
MKIHICIPYSIDKKLGKVYNQAMSQIPDGDSACLMDYDVQLLTPDAGKIIHEYANKYPHNLLTCFTNRVHPNAKPQLLNEVLSEDTDIRTHIALAEEQKKHLYKVTPIKQWIAGMLMIVPKSLWLKYPFPETGKCLGIDTYYSKMILRRGVEILRMDGIYCWHSYRLMNGIFDKKHLM